MVKTQVNPDVPADHSYVNSDVLAAQEGEVVSFVVELEE